MHVFVVCAAPQNTEEKEEEEEVVLVAEEEDDFRILYARVVNKRHAHGFGLCGELV